MWHFILINKWCLWVQSTLPIHNLPLPTVCPNPQSGYNQLPKVSPQDLAIPWIKYLEKSNNFRRGAAIAQWIRLRLPFCRPGFDSQTCNLCFFSLICDLFVHAMWEKNQKSKKRPGLALFCKKNFFVFQKFSVSHTFSQFRGACHTLASAHDFVAGEYATLSFRKDFRHEIEVLAHAPGKRTAPGFYPCRGR